MPTKKKVSKKKTNKASAKVNVVVNVNSGNRKKVVGGGKSANPMPSVAPPSVAPTVVPRTTTPSINITSPPPHNALSDGHREFIDHLKSSMSNPNFTFPMLRAPNSAFQSPEGVQGDLGIPNVPWASASATSPILLAEGAPEGGTLGSFQSPAPSTRAKSEGDPEAEVEHAEAEVEHHQVGGHGEPVQTFLNDLRRHARAVFDRTPPNMRTNPMFGHQDSPPLEHLPSPSSATRHPVERSSGSFVAPLRTRSGGVYPRFL